MRTLDKRFEDLAFTWHLVGRWNKEMWLLITCYTCCRAKWLSHNPNHSRWFENNEIDRLGYYPELIEAINLVQIFTIASKTKSYSCIQERRPWISLLSYYENLTDEYYSATTLYIWMCCFRFICGILHRNP